MNSEATCPYCDYEEMDSWEIQCGNGNTIDWECSDCQFKVGDVVSGVGVLKFKKGTIQDRYNDQYWVVHSDGTGAWFKESELLKEKNMINLGKYFAETEVTQEQLDEINELLGIDPKKWMPEHQQHYYYIDDTGNIFGSRYFNTIDHNYRILMDNYYQTEEQAQEALKFQTEQRKLIKEIEDSSDVIDWNFIGQFKYYFYLNYGTVIVGATTGYYRQGSPHTTNKEFLENLIKNEPERVKKYLFGVSHD